MDNTKGNCLGYTTLYLALAERLSLPLFAVTLPYHVFVRYGDGVYQKDIECTNGRDFFSLEYILNLRNMKTFTKESLQYQVATKKEMIGYMLINRGSSKGERKDFDGAIADCTKAIEITSNYALAYYNRGTAKRRKGDNDGAIMDCTKAIEIKPDCAEAYHERGISRINVNNLDEAINDFSKAIEIVPSGSTAYYNRGIAKNKKGDIDGEIADYTKAIEIRPDYAEAYYGRGFIKGKKGDYDGALKDWEQAIRLNPSYEKELRPAIEKAKQAKEK